MSALRIVPLRRPDPRNELVAHDAFLLEAEEAAEWERSLEAAGIACCDDHDPDPLQDDASPLFRGILALIVVCAVFGFAWSFLR